MRSRVLYYTADMESFTLNGQVLEAVHPIACAIIVRRMRQCDNVLRDASQLRSSRHRVGQADCLMRVVEMKTTAGIVEITVVRLAKEASGFPH